MNPWTRRAALYAIGAIAILASANALTHSYAGLYDWAVHHRLSGWQAMSWPAEIDVFLAIGELSLYIAYLDGWPTRHRVWPWATALTGLTVSIAGNIGHIQAEPGQPVILADRLTAATSPIAAFAGLTVGLLVLKMTRRQAGPGTPGMAVPVTTSTQPAGTPRLRQPVVTRPAMVPALGQDPPAGAGTQITPPATRSGPVLNGAVPRPPLAANCDRPRASGRAGADRDAGRGLLRDASMIYQSAAASGERISQRTLARQLRGHGHRFSNQHLHGIAASIGLAPEKAGLP
jgi:hypothetical protein